MCNSRNEFTPYWLNGVQSALVELAVFHLYINYLDKFPQNRERQTKDRRSSNRKRAKREQFALTLIKLYHKCH